MILFVVFLVPVHALSGLLHVFMLLCVQCLHLWCLDEQIYDPRTGSY